MRKIIAFNRVSADGYFSAPDGSLEWTVQDEALDKAAAGRLDTTDAILFGRRTYDMFESFWPHAVDDSPTAPAPHGEPRRSREMRELGAWINAATKIVYSRTRSAVTWRGSRLIGEFDPREIAALKRQPGKDIMIFGSGSIASQLTAHGLIDEYQFVVSPVVLGSGHPLLSGIASRVPLALADATPYPSGHVMLRYTHAG